MSGTRAVLTPLPLLCPCSVSKQQAIMPGQSYGLEDGSCSYKDFSGSRNNRFSTPEQAAKNRIQHPSNVLHFFNAPLEVTEENFYEVSRPMSGFGAVCCILLGFGAVHPIFRFLPVRL